MKLLLLCGAALLVGCGGKGGGSEPPSSLAGHWTGSWGQLGSAMPPPGDSGSWDITIAPNGTVTGTSQNTGFAQSGPITGTISPTGDLALSIDYPSHDVLVDGNLGTELTGSCVFATEQFNRTVHLYVTAVNLDKQ